MGDASMANEDAAERARLRLADCVHRVTSDTSMEVREIKRKALAMLLIIDNIRKRATSSVTTVAACRSPVQRGRGC